MNDGEFFVYILTNNHLTALYTGVTNDLYRRMLEHKAGIGSKFTKKYNLTKLVYYEIWGNPTQAIDREKLIKAGPRKKKIELIERFNPLWDDLFDDME